MSNQYYTSTAGRAGNAALLISGMLVLFFITSAILITVPGSWEFYDASSVSSLVTNSMVLYGIGIALIFFFWKTRPFEEEK